MSWCRWPMACCFGRTVISRLKASATPLSCPGDPHRCGGWTLSYYGLVLYSAAWPVNAFRSSTSHASRLDRNRRPVSMTVELRGFEL